MVNENRKHPILCPLRTTRTERALIDTLAEREGTSVARLLRSIVIPEVTERMEAVIAEIAGPESNSQNRTAP